MRKCSRGLPRSQRSNSNWVYILDNPLGHHRRQRELTQEHQHANSTNTGSDPVVEPKTSLAWECCRLLHKAKYQTQDLNKRIIYWVPKIIENKFPVNSELPLHLGEGFIRFHPWQISLFTSVLVVTCKARCWKKILGDTRMLLVLSPLITSAAPDQIRLMHRWSLWFRLKTSPNKDFAVKLS